MDDSLILLQAKLDEAKSKKALNSDIKKIQDQINKLKLQAEVDPKAISRIVKQLEDILNQKITISNIDIDASKIKQSGTQIGESFGENIASGIGKSSSKITSEVQKIANQIEARNQRNSRATKEVISTNEVYTASLKDLNSQMTKMQFDEIVEGFNKSESSMHGLGKLGKSLADQLKQAVAGFSSLVSPDSIVMLITSKIKDSVSELKDVNTLLTEISKANDRLSKSELTQIGSNSFDVASKYGKSATDYLSGVQEASRAGYENAEAIAELSVAAQGAGDMTAELTNQYIIATDKAYKFQGSVEKLTEVLDGSNNITNHNAVNMTELAEGMSIVGSQAASLGVEANETTAVLGTMIATTQQSGSEMAKAFRAILLYLQQVSDEEEGIDAEGLTKYENACNALGVSLKETRKGILQLRDPMEVIKDLAEEYSKLDASDIRRTNLLSSVGGELRSNALNAILENYDMYENMLQQYADGRGSMAAEAEKTANSWEGSLNRLSNTWTATVGNIANSDAIITILNGLNGLLSVINNITKSLGPLESIGVGAGLFAGLNNIGRDKMHSLIYICFE